MCARQGARLTGESPETTRQGERHSDRQGLKKKLGGSVKNRLDEFAKDSETEFSDSLSGFSLSAALNPESAPGKSVFEPGKASSDFFHFRQTPCSEIKLPFFRYGILTNYFFVV